MVFFIRRPSYFHAVPEVICLVLPHRILSASYHGDCSFDFCFYALDLKELFHKVFVNLSLRQETILRSRRIVNILTAYSLSRFTNKICDLFLQARFSRKVENMTVYCIMLKTLRYSSLFT